MLRATALLLFVAGCTAAAKDVVPPNGDLDCPDDGDSSTPPCQARFFWPTGVAMSPDESVLFVADANSDLTYNSGRIDVLDLAKVEEAITSWTTSHTLADHCTKDTDFSETMDCPETPYLKRDAAVLTGNFATAIGVQTKDSDGNLRLVVPVRGDPSITWIDWVKNGADRFLQCKDTDVGTYATCDDDHKLTRLRDDNDTTEPGIADEPFDVFVDSVNDFAVVTHLSSGSASLVDLPKTGMPSISDAIGGLFGADPETGVVGASAVAGRDPGSPDDIVYVASRSEDRVQTFTIVRPRAQPALLQAGDFFFLNTVGTQSGGSRDTRGLAFGSGGDRMYLINRYPPTLQIYDTSLSPQGTPKNEGLAAVDICRQASRLVLTDTGDGDRVYVACFDAGQIYAIDPRDGGQVIDVITVGRGPYDLAASPSKKRLYVSNYLENTIAVIDLAPGSPTRNRVVLRLGEPKKP
jgi:6-phosphogluconolactonase (cycloisomerase 2 family)